jgi:hypothetical protein
MNADDLDALDRAILDYLQEGRHEADQPWGISTPAEVRAALEDRGMEGVPVRQTVNNRMKRLELAGHLRNRYEKGLYEFVSDPRNAHEETE